MAFFMRTTMMTMMMMMIMGGAHLLHGQIHCLLCRFEAFSSSNDKKPKPLRDVQVQIGNYSTAPNKTVQKKMSVRNVCIVLILTVLFVDTTFSQTTEEIAL